MPRKQKQYHYIYKTTNVLTNKFYVGMHSTDNLEDGYIGSGKRLWYSIRKYGKENHKCEILEFLSSREELKNREAEIVNEELLSDSMCMNLKYGGEGGFLLTKEQFIKRNSKCGLKNAEKIRNDPEHFQKFSESRKKTNKRVLPEQNRRLNPERNKRIHFGKKRTDETKQKMSDSKIGNQNGMFGKVWIFNLNLRVSKIVDKNELDFFLADGWQKGRKLNFDQPFVN